MKKAIPALLLSLLFNSSFITTGHSPLRARAGKDYAVFFYVTQFQPGWLALPDTKPEAQSLATVLESDYGFEKPKLVPNPTRQQILDEIAAWNNRLGPDDQVLFFFSMHGYYDPNSELGYLIAADGQYRDDYHTTWLDYNSLRPYFARCKAKHILVALDACYSGSFGKIEKAPDHPVYDESQSCETQVANSFGYQVRQYICAGSKDAKTPGKSLFADKLLETLRRGNTDSDGILHFDDITYALGKVRDPEPVHGSFSGHTAGGEFLFVRKNACTQKPDRDGDTVPDDADHCPDTWGSQANGCPPDPQQDNTALDLEAWRTAKRLNTPAAYQEYLRKFPLGEFKEPANKALRDIETAAATRRDNDAWDLATEKNTADGYKKYIALYPNGLHRTEADAQLKAFDKPDNMMLITGGSFQMGSEDGSSDEKPIHTVRVSDFYLSKYELTVAEFRAFIEDSGYKTDAEKEDGSYIIVGTEWKTTAGINWRHDEEGNTAIDNHPVIHVSWNDAVAYCQWLSSKTGQNYRLPTEAEWEYAAGNGAKHTKYSWGNGDPVGKKGGNVSDMSAKSKFSGWDIFENYTDGFVFAAPVGSFDKNDLGLFDMSGNVWEWCSDWYDGKYYSSSPGTNPTGPGSGSDRVIRGGSWGNDPQNCRVAFRNGNSPGYRNYFIGFRLARTK